MPQLDLYIWFNSVANLTSFFFVFYFFFIEFLLVNIVRVYYMKWGLLDLVQFAIKYVPKLNYVLDNGLFANVYIYFFSKKSILLKTYNQLIAIYVKMLKLFICAFLTVNYCINELFFKQYDFNILKGSLYLSLFLKI